MVGGKVLPDDAATARRHAARRGARAPWYGAPEAETALLGCGVYNSFLFATEAIYTTTARVLMNSVSVLERRGSPVAVGGGRGAAGVPPEQNFTKSDCKCFPILVVVVVIYCVRNSSSSSSSSSSSCSSFSSSSHSHRPHPRDGAVPQGIATISGVPGGDGCVRNR
eukprot:4705073-Pyramimonas_sp.AAC.1